MQRRIITFIYLLIFSAGGWALWTTERDILPQTAVSSLYVRIISAGLDPERIYQRSAKPLEKLILSDFKNVRVISQCRPGIGEIFLTCSSPAQAAQIASYLSNRIAGLIPKSSSVLIESGGFNRLPSAVIAFSGDSYQNAAAEFLSAVKKLPSISSAEIYNGPSSELHLTFEPERPSLYGLSIMHIKQALSRFASETNCSEERLRELPVGSTRLNKVTAFEEGGAPQFENFYFNGQKACLVAVRKTQGADVLSAMESVKRELTFVLARSPGVNAEFVKDLSVYTRQRLVIASWNLILGLLLIAASIAVFLRLTAALWISLSIPFTLCFSFLLLRPMHISINAVSLLGLITAMGMVVDNSIVVSETLRRLRTLNLTAGEKVKLAVKESFTPVSAMVAATIVSFLPMLALTGDLGRFIRQIPLVVSLMLLASWIESMFLLPHLLSHSSLLNAADKESSLLARAEITYTRWLKKALHRPKTVLTAASLLILISSAYLLIKVPYLSFPTKGARRFEINARLPGSMSLGETYAALADIEKHLSSLKSRSVENRLITCGEGAFQDRVNIFISLHADAEVNASQEILSTCRRLLQGNGFEDIRWSLDSEGPPADCDLRIRASGSSPEERSKALSAISELLKKEPGVHPPYEIWRKGWRQPMPLPLENYQNSNSLASIEDALLSVRPGLLIDSSNLLRPLRLLADKTSSADFNKLAFLSVENGKGKVVPISSAAMFAEKRFPAMLEHVNQQEVLSLEVNADHRLLTPLALGKTSAKLTADYLALTSAPADLKFEISAEAADAAEGLRNIEYIALLTLIALFAVVFITFRNLPVSLIILFNIPLAVPSLAFTALLHQIPMSYMALMGFVALKGMVVNNGIMLAHAVRKQKNADVIENIAEASAQRLRPVLLTVITSALGLLPTAFAFGGSDMLVMPCALVITWGLLITAMLTLFTAPVLHLLFCSNHKPA